MLSTDLLRQGTIIGTQIHQVICLSSSAIFSSLPTNYRPLPRICVLSPLGRSFEAASQPLVSITSPGQQTDFHKHLKTTPYLRCLSFQQSTLLLTDFLHSHLPCSFITTVANQRQVSVRRPPPPSHGLSPAHRCPDGCCPDACITTAPFTHSKSVLSHAHSAAGLSPINPAPALVSATGCVMSLSGLPAFLFPSAV